VADAKLNICLVCSHGGHLTEMLQLQDAFEGHDFFYFCYDADTTRRLPRAYRVPNMGHNVVEFAKNLARAHAIFRKERPDLVVSTGAEIALPVFFIAALLRIPRVYIECGAQVTTASFTGRITYWLSHRFYVQWPELLRVYGPRARFDGSFIDEIGSAKL
jgi:UDP-N-acetylglucosamine:LPS N-acetylglucosamine transferase